MYRPSGSICYRLNEKPLIKGEIRPRVFRSEAPEIRVEADDATELNRREKGKFYVGEHSIFIHATVHGICRF